MSKKKKKKAAPARKGAKKSKTSAKPARAGARRQSARVSAVESNRTFGATIFIYTTAAGLQIRTAPQRLTAGPGYIEWTVVNLASDEPVNGEITWPKGSPWGGNTPIPITNGTARVSLAAAEHGRFKYSVSANSVTEDPEVEIPWN
jgi:hypothetical protein